MIRKIVQVTEFKTIITLICLLLVVSFAVALVTDRAENGSSLATSQEKINHIVDIGTKRKVEDYAELANYLDDENIDVKTAAAQWIYQLNDPSFYPYVIEEYSYSLRHPLETDSSRKDYNRAISRAVSLMGYDAIPYLTELIRENNLNSKARAALAWHFGHLITKEGLVAENKDPLLISTLKTLLNDEQWVVKLRAAGSLGRAGLDDGYEIALQALSDATANSYHKVVASWALAFIAKPEGIEIAISSAIKELNNTPDFETLYEGIHALSNLCSNANAISKPQVIKSVLPYLENSSPEIRENTIRTLGSCKDFTAFESLVDVLQNDPNDNVRFQVAQAFWRWQYQPSALVLIESLNDPYIETRKWCLNALKKLHLTDDMKKTLSEKMLNEPDLKLKKKYSNLIKRKESKDHLKF